MEAAYSPGLSCNLPTCSCPSEPTQKECLRRGRYNDPTAPACITAGWTFQHSKSQVMTSWSIGRGLIIKGFRRFLTSMTRNQTPFQSTVPPELVELRSSGCAYIVMKKGWVCCTAKTPCHGVNPNIKLSGAF